MSKLNGFVISAMLALCVCVCGCASQSQQNLDTVQQSFDDMTHVEQHLDYFLIDTNGLTANQIAEQEERRYQQIKPCIEEYDKQSGRLLGTLASKEQAYELPGKLQTVDDQYSKCVHLFGLTSKIYIVTSDGQQYDVPTYWARIVSLAQARGNAMSHVFAEDAQRQTSRQNMWTGLAAGFGAAAAAYPSQNTTIIQNGVSDDLYRKSLLFPDPYHR